VTLLTGSQTSRSKGSGMIKISRNAMGFPLCPTG
jgi:hypothetical protein